MSISLVAGLGNPGRDYEATRHNIGWVVIEALAQKHGLTWKKVADFEAAVARWDRAGQTLWLVKPLTYMNASGRAVGGLARYYKLPVESVAVVYDDLTIDLGLTKVTVSGTAGGHNGVDSVLEHLGGGFARYRIGIGPKPAQMELTDFVLGKFTPEEHAQLSQKLDSYVTGLDLLLSRGIDTAMNHLNRRDSK